MAKVCRASGSLTDFMFKVYQSKGISFWHRVTIYNWLVVNVLQIYNWDFTIVLAQQNSSDNSRFVDVV